MAWGAFVFAVCVAVLSKKNIFVPMHNLYTPVFAVEL